ncbi:MAG: hypothetical protein ABI983_10140 [Acidobacteriota bacterium]
MRYALRRYLLALAVIASGEGLARSDVALREVVGVESLATMDSSENDRARNSRHYPIASNQAAGLIGAADTIFTDGFDRFYFFMPYAADGSLPPSPSSMTFALSSQIGKADVAFIVDTTGSMSGEIIALKTNLSSVIIPSLQASVPSLAIGIAAHDDVPYSTYGTTGDLPFYFSITPQGYVTTTPSASQTAANALTTHDGLDGPEAQILAMHHALAGSGITWPGGAVAPMAPSAGIFGAMHFRTDAFSIVVNITDAAHHNGKRALDKTGATYDAAVQNAYSFPTWDVNDLAVEMGANSAKFIGVIADGGARAMGTADPYGYAAYVADMTASDVPPSAFAGATCNTGVAGVAVAADGPTLDTVHLCRSVFSINTNGAGLATAVVSGVAAELAAAKLDVYAQAYNDASEFIDVVGAFMLRVEPIPAGGTDPATGNVCLTIPAQQLADNFTGPKAIAGPDGHIDTITQVATGEIYCFAVVPKANSTVAATTAVQVFRAWIRIRAVRPNDRALVLSADREVFFLVPRSN